MRNAVIVEACRTAVGSMGGGLKPMSAYDLACTVLQGILDRSQIDPKEIEEVILGQCRQTSDEPNIARMAALKVGIPESASAYTVMRQCASGMTAVQNAAMSVMTGNNDVVLAGGTESMSNAVFYVRNARWGVGTGNTEFVDALTEGQFRSQPQEMYGRYNMGATAENVAEAMGITREEQDAFAAASQQKAEAAQASGRFDDEIVAVPVKVKKEIVEFKRDEYPKAGVTAQSVAKLRGAFPVLPETVDVVHTFEPTGIHADDANKNVQRVTAANASDINDGAAAIILASGEAVEKYGLKPMAKLTGWGQGGVDPKIMGVGPVPASRAAMAKAGVTIDDIDLIEANEAFAAQSIAVGRELGFDMAKVNVNGGAIALGHPVGASGARIIVTLVHEMAKREDAKRGLATLCIGGGQGTAVIVEKC